MSARTDVLLWAQRVLGRKGAAAHLLLDIAADAGPDAVQDAFHKIARLAHPDLHRTTLSPDELELVNEAYARVAAAYQELRGRTRGRSREPVSSPAIPIDSPPAKPAAVDATGCLAPRPAGGAPTPRRAASLIDEPAGPPAMAPKAMMHYRKAELCLRRGELIQAVLHLKMAIASDPQSTFLRKALAQVEAEVGKKP